MLSKLKPLLTARVPLYNVQRTLISQSLRDQDPNDESLLERKKLKTVEHYLPEKPPSRKFSKNYLKVMHLFQSDHFY